MGIQSKRSEWGILNKGGDTAALGDFWNFVWGWGNLVDEQGNYLAECGGGGFPSWTFHDAGNAATETTPPNSKSATPTARCKLVWFLWVDLAATNRSNGFVTQDFGRCVG